MGHAGGKGIRCSRPVWIPNHQKRYVYIRTSVSRQGQQGQLFHNDHVGPENTAPFPILGLPRGPAHGLDMLLQQYLEALTGLSGPPQTSSLPG